MKCLGFPDGVACPHEAGTRWTPYWCPECDEKRRAHITAQLEAIQAKLSEAQKQKEGEA